MCVRHDERHGELADAVLSNGPPACEDSAHKGSEEEEEATAEELIERTNRLSDERIEFEANTCEEEGD